MIRTVKSLFVGMGVVFKHLFKRPVTLEYPEKMPNLPDSHRGLHSLEGCIGCGVCKKVCPANAISIEKTDNKVSSYVVDLNKCIFCGQCQFYCPVKAIKLTKKFDLASDNKNNLVLHLVEPERKGDKC